MHLVCTVCLDYSHGISFSSIVTVKNASHGQNQSEEI